MKKKKAPNLRSVSEYTRRFVYRLSILIRTSRIHSASNQAMRYSLNVASKASCQLLEEMGEVQLLGEGEVVHVNAVKVRVARSMTSTVRFLNDYLRTRGLGGFEVKDETTVDDWEAVVQLLMELPEVSEDFDAAAPLNLQLDDQGIDCIRFSSPMKLRKGALASLFGGEGQSVRIATTRALQLYVRAAKSLENLRRHGARRGKGTVMISRVVQYLVESAIDEPRHHLALINLKDDSFAYSLRHPVHTCILSIALGHRLGLPRAALLDLGISALTCDLGMAAVDESILGKEGPLTKAEWKLIHRHPLRSCHAILKNRSLELSTRRQLQVAFEHHLRMDLGGYPDVLQWSEQHLFTRIIAVCETYDALTTSRPWRHGMLPDEALGELLSLRGKQLDPELVVSFINMIGRYPLGTTLMLSTGAVGVVYLNHPDVSDHLTPVVRLVIDEKGEPVRGLELLDLRQKPEVSIARSVDFASLGLDMNRSLYS